MFLNHFQYLQKYSRYIAESSMILCKIMTTLSWYRYFMDISMIFLEVSRIFYRKDIICDIDIATLKLRKYWRKYHGKCRYFHLCLGPCDVLNFYNATSGQLVNFDKSKVCFSKEAPYNTRVDLADFL